MRRTSLSHPLRIDAVPYPDGAGLIGVTFCPGKKQRDGASGWWDRDLDADLDVIASWGPRRLISLVTGSELAELQVADLDDGARRRDIHWLHLPIEDTRTPDAGWEAQWSSASPGIHQVLVAGGRVVVHCKGGLGRAGTVAARILIEAGASAESAIAQVRQHRPGAIENLAQETYLRNLSSRRAAP